MVCAMAERPNRDAWPAVGSALSSGRRQDDRRRGHADRVAEQQADRGGERQRESVQIGADHPNPAFAVRHQSVR